MIDKIRKKVFRKFDVGTIFRETDGLYELMARLDSPDLSGTYDYYLRKLSADEAAVYDVLHE